MGGGIGPADSSTFDLRPAPRHRFGSVLRSNFERMRGLRWILAGWLAFWLASDRRTGPLCLDRNGLPYVSTNPNYVCEALDAFVYINVAQGYANPSDAARRTSTSWSV